MGTRVPGKRYPGPKLLQHQWEEKGEERGEQALGALHHHPALLSSP